MAKTTATPLRAPVAQLFGQASLDESWAGFRPTATGVEELTVHAAGQPVEELVATAAQMLRDHGIVAITGLVDAAVVDAAAREVDGLMEQVNQQTATGALHGELFGSLWQVGHSKIPTYYGMINHPTPVIFIRARDQKVADAGMIDIFQFDRLAADLNLDANLALLGSAYRTVVPRIVEQLMPFGGTATNLYHNSAVTNTRGLHVDSLDPSYKAFLYLRDVLEPKDGPYTFVPGSQREAALLAKSVYLNRSRKRSETDMPELKGREVAMLAPRGTVIISSQAGIHGGHPQTEGGLRTAIVSNYLRKAG